MTAWTVGLFGAGEAIARASSAPWVEPVVLLALGLAFLFVSARMGVRAARPASTPRPVATLPARAPAAAQAPATVPVEQSA